MTRISFALVALLVAAESTSGFVSTNKAISPLTSLGVASSTSRVYQDVTAQEHGWRNDTSFSPPWRRATQQHSKPARPKRRRGYKSYNKYRQDTISFNKMLLREVDPQRAQDVLLHCISNKHKHFDLVSFNHVMTKWASVGNAQQALFLLRKLESIQATFPHLRPPDVFSYAAVLNALSKSGGGRQAALDAEALLQETLQNLPNLSTDVCHNAVINAWSACEKDDAGVRAQAILDNLVQCNLATRISYNACIKAWVQSGHVQQAEGLLNKTPCPDNISYTTVMGAYGKMGHVEKAQDLLDEMQLLSNDPSSLVQVDTIAYTTLLGAYSTVSRTNGVSYCRQATNLLRQMIQQGLQVNKVTYTAVISCHAQCGQAVKAEALLEELIQLYQTTNKNEYKPNTKTFASVLQAWSNSGSTDALDRAYRLLERMHELNVRPNTIVYSQVLTILSNCKEHGEVIAKRADKLLQSMEKMGKTNRDVRPDATTFAYLINTYTKSGIRNAVDRADKVLTMVEARYFAGEEHLQPTALLYSAVLQSYAKSARPRGAKGAEELLQRNKEWYRTGREFAKPNALCYNAVMDAHARSGVPEAANRAQELLVEMEAEAGLVATTRSFNAAILAWKNSDSPATVQAEALLRTMNDRYKDGDVGCKPDAVTINSIIGVWAKSGKRNAGTRAEAFLNLMERVYQAGDITLKPDRYSFNGVMHAYARVGDGPSAQRLFERMADLYERTGDVDFQPDRITLASLKAAWVKQASDQDSLKRLTEVKELEQRQLRRQERAVAH